MHASTCAEVNGGAIMRYWDRCRATDNEEAIVRRVDAVVCSVTWPLLYVRRADVVPVRVAGTQRDAWGLRRWRRYAIDRGLRVSDRGIERSVCSWMCIWWSVRAFAKGWLSGRRERRWVMRWVSASRASGCFRE